MKEAHLFIDLPKGPVGHIGGSLRAGAVDGFQVRPVLQKPLRLLPDGPERLDDRLALARAFAYAKDKSLLILDEPFTGVDPPTAEKIMSSLRTLPLPILFTAHDSESLSLADTVLPFQQITAKS